MSAITIGGELVHYEVLGRGRPVLLLHGWVGSWRYWVPTMQLLQTKFRVYALDLFGFGDSGKNRDKYSIEHQIALLDDFMARLAINKAAIIGHGLGGLIAAEFARRYQERVPRLLLISLPLFNPGDLDRRTPIARDLNRREANTLGEGGNPDAKTTMSPSAAMRRALQEAAAQTARSTGTFSSVFSAEHETMPDLPQHNPLSDILNGHGADVLLARCFKRSEPHYDRLNADIAKTDAQVFKRSVEHFDSGRMLDTLRQLPMPIGVIHGADDPLLPQPDEDVLNYITLEKDNLLLAMRLQGVRHFPMLEYERFHKFASDFLEAPDISRLELKERWQRRTR